MSRVVRTLFISIFSAAIAIPSVFARQAQDTGAPPAQQKLDKATKRKVHKTLKELGFEYRQWLTEDVTYIISPEERNAFLQLDTNEEREQFIEQFWLRRSSNPDLPENDFKEEHYRRIAYANEHYASGIPGWKTDRGRMYIMWGPADEVESHPTGGTYDRPMEEGGGSTSTYPWETWRWRYLEGINLPKTMGGEPASMNEFNRLELYAKVNKPPEVKFKDLEAVVTSRIVRDQVHFHWRTDYLKVTNDTVLVPVTVQVPNSQLSFQAKDGIHTAVLNIFGRVSTLTGRVVQTFEDSMSRDFPDSLYQQSLKLQSIYQKAVPLRPGLYRLDLVIKDVQSGNIGVVNSRLQVPRYEDDKLEASSLILADQIERVPAKQIGAGQFVLGSSKVRPRLEADFITADRLGIYMQIYNLKPDDKTHKSSATFQYTVKKGKDQIMQVKQSETGTAPSPGGPGPDGHGFVLSGDSGRRASEACPGQACRSGTRRRRHAADGRERGVDFRSDGSSGQPQLPDEYARDVPGRQARFRFLHRPRDSRWFSSNT